MDKRNTIFIIIFLVIIINTPLIIFLSGNQEFSYSENRELVQLPTSIDEYDIESFFDKKLQDTLENGLSDQFLFRASIQDYIKRLELEFGMVFAHNTEPTVEPEPVDPEPEEESFDYLVEADKKTYVTPTDFTLHSFSDTGVYYLSSEPNRAFNGPILDVEGRIEKVTTRIEEINSLVDEYPEISFYVYKPTQIQETSFFDQDNGISSLGPRFDELFKTLLKAEYKSFKLDDFTDYQKSFYLTDHHWNQYGSQIGYEEILEMLSPNEKPYLPTGQYCIYDKMYGTFTYRVGRVIEGEDFCIYDYDLPDNEFLYSDQWRGSRKDTKAFQDKDYKNNNLNYYDIAFAQHHGVISQYNEGKEGNLLVIRDSYANTITDLLAHHFKNVFFVHPVYYWHENGKHLNYREFIEEYEIDKVLFMYTIENYFYDEAYENYVIH